MRSREEAWHPRVSRRRPPPGRIALGLHRRFRSRLRPSATRRAPSGPAPPGRARPASCPPGRIALGPHHRSRRSRLEASAPRLASSGPFEAEPSAPRRRRARKALSRFGRPRGFQITAARHLANLDQRPSDFKLTHYPDR